MGLFSGEKRGNGEVVKKKVFVCYDFDHDQPLLDEIATHVKQEDCPYEIGDWSQEPWDKDLWKERCLAKMKKCNLVLVMVGEKSHIFSWVKDEIKLAREARIPVVGIRGYKDKACQQPDGLEAYYENWTWENINDIVGGAR
jgi:hypothetical protein